MTKPSPDLPAFPFSFIQGSDPHGADVSGGWEGMTLRTYLAGQALAGLAGTPEFLLQAMADAKANPEELTFTQAVARASVRLADATLAELAKEKPLTT